MAASWHWLVWLVMLGACGAEAAVASREAWKLEWRLFTAALDEKGVERWSAVTVTNRHDLAGRSKGPAFLAMMSDRWPPGFVPVFDVEEAGTVVWRRRAKRGQENSAEPLFFGMPGRDESAALLLAGAWECTATNALRSKNYFGWELTVDERDVSGRFDPSSEFRFAYMTGGSFRSNRVELQVEYIADRYQLTGTWKEGKMRGVWRHLEHEEQGTWEAERPAGEVRIAEAGPAVGLYEWRREAEKGMERRYRLEGAPGLGPEWVRSVKPLALVWRP